MRYFVCRSNDNVALSHRGSHVYCCRNTREKSHSRDMLGTFVEVGEIKVRLAGCMGGMCL